MSDLFFRVKKSFFFCQNFITHGATNFENFYLVSYSNTPVKLDSLAPYVAGQLVKSMEKNFDTFLLGHNPPDKAKPNPIEKWDSTFLATVQKLQAYEKGTLITPVFGGECISGSSRMKA